MFCLRSLNHRNLKTTIKFPSSTHGRFAVRRETTQKNESLHPLQQYGRNFKEFMIKDREIGFKIPLVNKRINIPIQFSNMAGHGSFMLLAISYLESDFLSLRMYAFSGITLSIIFQYYREKPLWIPIRWNTLFLAINFIMIMLLMNEEHSLSNLPEEVQTLYSTLFENRGMKPLEFRYLMSIANRHHMKKGEKLATQGKPINSLYVVSSGRMNACRDNDIVAKITENQFIGELSFLRMEELYDQHKHNPAAAAQAASESKSSATPPVSDNAQSSIAQWYNALTLTPKDTTEETVAVAPSNSIVDLNTLLASADVICDEDAIVYSWSFSNLHQLFMVRPALGVMLDRCISLDLSKKLSSKRTAEQAIDKGFKQVLVELITRSNGELTDQNKVLLKELQTSLRLGDAVRDQILSEIGWTRDEYILGYKGGPTADVLTNYLSMLRAVLSYNTVTEADRERLRVFRREHHIVHSRHLEMLAQLHWTPDEYEDGCKADD